MIVVTTFEIPGYRINAVLGEVMGLTVRSLNLGTSFTAGLRSLGGGEITEYTKIMYQSRQEVMNRMVVEAESRGANAIVAMRFDTDSIQQFSEVCAYGTAVVVEPIGAGEPGATPQSAQLAGAAAADRPTRD
ncbi:MAG: YbjQ family protein [Actinobacteria bacterium]|nr:YbjQ family protein [Actinomycetota bacterium]MCG2799807.1 YbjQ family protein [Cellulomonas sp.]